MIRGVHTMFYSSDAPALREFLRDRLGFRAVDVGEGWLIFDLPEAEMGCHPLHVDPLPSGSPAVPPSGTAAISFYCDDLVATMELLRGRGVEFEGEVQNHGYGLVTRMRVPGNFTIDLYQPLYKKSTNSEPDSRLLDDASGSPLSSDRVLRPPVTPTAGQVLNRAE